MISRMHFWGASGFPGGTSVKNWPASFLLYRTYEIQVPSLGWEDPLEEAWQPTQYSCLENPMDRGVWQSTVHRVIKSWTWLKQFSTHAGNKWQVDTQRYSFNFSKNIQTSINLSSYTTIWMHMLCIIFP